MTEETARLLIEAANRLAAAIERATGLGAAGGGIHIYHHNVPTPPPMQQPWYPSYTSGGQAF